MKPYTAIFKLKQYEQYNINTIKDYYIVHSIGDRIKLKGFSVHEIISVIYIPDENKIIYILDKIKGIYEY